MSTTQVRTVSDISTQWLASHGGQHADMINHGVLTPDDTRFVAALIEQLIDKFNKETLPADCDYITQLNFYTRVGMAFLNGAAWCGIEWRLMKGAQLVLSDGITLPKVVVPTNYNLVNTGLNISKADFEASDLWLTSQGGLWGFGQAYVRINELDMNITYVPIPTSVPKEIELRSKIRDQYEVESLINSSVDLEAKVRDALSVESKITKQITLRAKIRDSHEI